MIVVENFLNYMKVLKKSPNTISSYSFDLKLWMRFQFPEVKEVTVEKLEAVMLQEFYNYLSSISHKASASQARTVSSIKMLYLYLLEFNLIKTNPAEKLHQPKVENKLPKFMNEAQSINLLESVDNYDGRFPERDYAILTLFLNTGIRESELVGINLSDIDDDILTVTGKGSKQRQIPLSESCLDAIQQYLAVRPNVDTNALFLNRNKVRLERHGVITVVKKYLKISGNGNLSAHKLRHTAATMWLTNGADITKIQEMLGHSSILTTMLYTHVTPDDKRKVVANTGLASIKRNVKNIIKQERRTK
jgi:integrase/recombinase XerD